MSKYPGLNLSGNLSMYRTAPKMYIRPPRSQGNVKKSCKYVNSVKNSAWTIGNTEHKPQMTKEVPRKVLNLGPSKPGIKKVMRVIEQEVYIIPK